MSLTLLTRLLSYAKGDLQAALKKAVVDNREKCGIGLTKGSQMVSTSAKTRGTARRKPMINSVNGGEGKEQ